jgi:hypothetical protein
MLDAWFPSTDGDGGSLLVTRSSKRNIPCCPPRSIEFAAQAPPRITPITRSPRRPSPCRGDLRTSLQSDQLLSLLPTAE